MKIIETTTYHAIPLPDGSIRKIPIPNIEVVNDTEEKRQPLYQSLKEYRIFLVSLLAVAIIGVSITVNPPSLEANTALDSNCRLNSSQPEYILKWESEIESACQQYHVPANLLGALIDVESDGDPNAISKDWACGLTQVVSNSNMMTNSQGIRYFTNRPTCYQLTSNPQFAVDEGARLLRQHYDRTKNWKEALFNYGPEGVGYSYADDVLGLYKNYGN